MAITFSDVTYGPGYWGVVYMFHHLGTIDYVCTDAIVINGTVNQTGDTVSVSYLGDTFTFTVTQYDSSGAMVLSFGADLYAISNTPLSQGQVLELTTDGPNEYVPHACFAAGTRILTRRGEVAVEALVVGDEVMALLDHGFATVAWIGRQHIDCTTVRHPADLWPLRVRAHAFAPGRPHRDLFLSPDHAVHVDGALIPIRHLENATTIARDPRDTVTYFHVELDRHDLLLAEGLAAESYLDTGNRADFAGVARSMAGSEARAHEAARIWAVRGCAPLHVAGPVVEAARARLAARAMVLGHAPTDDPALRLRAEGVDHPADMRDGLVWHFTLPQRCHDTRLVSDSFVPAALFPGQVDRRCLGVPVARLMADGQEIPLHHPALSRGWHRPEKGLRWTAGAAQLPPLRTLSVVLAPIERVPAWTAPTSPAAVPSGAPEAAPAKVKPSGAVGRLNAARGSSIHLPFALSDAEESGSGAQDSASGDRRRRRNRPPETLRQPGPQRAHEPLESRPAEQAAPTE